MSIYEMAKSYYPRLWDKARIELLVSAKRLTREQADEIYAGSDGETPAQNDAE